MRSSLSLTVSSCFQWLGVESAMFSSRLSLRVSNSSALRPCWVLLLGSPDRSWAIVARFLKYLSLKKGAMDS
ncbi:hypothetical protein [Rubritalea tangerina]|uniref:hypothetical protein n=1 Tax=Rubritalea tangerina TaxID=430798 RepID=UPI003615E3E0